MNNENKIITYINSKDLGGNFIRHELHEHKNWQNIPYWFLVDAYLDEEYARPLEALRIIIVSKMVWMLLKSWLVRSSPKSSEP